MRRWIAALCALVGACSAPVQTQPAGGGSSAPGVGPVVLPAQCPCPLGSYCDLSTNACTLGCLGNDHCPADQRCDTTVYQCALACTTDDDCPDHLACTTTSSDASICKGCADGFDDCNHNPSDGCETSLDTLTDCDECGVPAGQTCYQDKDGDGYINRATGTVRCNCEPNETSYGYKGDDCADDDYRAHPGQTEFFSTPTPSGSFDFDCDGVVTPSFVYPVDGTCSWPCHGAFWSNMSPACGTMGMLVDCYQWDTQSCAKAQPSAVLQTCR